MGLSGLLLATLTALTGCQLESQAPEEDPAQPGESAPDQPATAAPERAGALPGLPTPDEARTRLAELTVAEPGSMAGYSRSRFPHWRTTDGCTVRQLVLARDGENVRVDDDCQPTSGEWYSLFDSVTLTDASELDIDHIVPLANAWRSGADAWDDDERKVFANDLDNPQLIAVSARSNREKGDQSPDQWQPVEEYWCEYGLAWTEVKHTYELTITQDEHDVVTEMLNTCAS